MPYLTHRFEIDITRDDAGDKGKRFHASCPRLTGCYVYASTKAEALRQLRHAIDAWLKLADDALGDDVTAIRGMMDMTVCL